MKQRHLPLLVLLAIAAFALPVQAETSIGIVNIQKIMNDSLAAKSVRDQLQSKQKSFQSELDAKEKALIKEDQDLVKQRANMDKDAFEQKVKSFRERAAKAQGEIQAKKASLDKAFAGALEQIQTNVVEITASVAKEKKLNVVISSAQVLYGDASLDITDEVLSQLNKKLSSVTLKF
jgi:Skp family chaperone for outer membrane proteins